MKKNGPNKAPRGTPEVTVNRSEASSSPLHAVDPLLYNLYTN